MTNNNKIINKYNESKLKLDNYIIDKMGFIKNKTVLKIKEYLIYCVPYELSFDNCKVFAFLSSSEVAFFSKFISSMHSINFYFSSLESNKETSVFLRIYIESFDVQNESSKNCSICLKIKSASEIYKEILSGQFQKIDTMKRHYEDTNLNYKLIDSKKLKETDMDHNVVYKFGSAYSYNGRIIDVSLKSIRIFGELSAADKNKENITVELFNNDINFFIKGKVIKITESKEVYGFFIIDANINFNYGFVDSICSVV
ncbi:MAG: hypothetical protein JXB50_14850 [Spirochaetes bacterium]|nr:hypothetical protein [Spirochaetota bacterium]